MDDWIVSYPNNQKNCSELWNFKSKNVELLLNMESWFHHEIKKVLETFYLTFLTFFLANASLYLYNIRMQLRVQTKGTVKSSRQILNTNPGCSRLAKTTLGLGLRPNLCLVFSGQHQINRWHARSQTQLTCRQMARFTLHPKEVLTARGCRPKSLKSLEKDWVRAILGLSSATTTHVLTRDRSSPRDWRMGQRETGLWIWAINL